MREIAQEVSIGLIGSYREKGEENPLNTCIAIGPDGRTLAKYSKIHLFLQLEKIFITQPAGHWDHVP